MKTHPAAGFPSPNKALTENTQYTLHPPYIHFKKSARELTRAHCYDVTYDVLCAIKFHKICAPNRDLWIVRFFYVVFGRRTLCLWRERALTLAEPFSKSLNVGLTGNGFGAGEYGSVEEVKMAGALWVAKKIQEVFLYHSEI